MYKIFISIFFAVLIFFVAFGQESNVIEGKIIDESDGTPISGANIRFKKSDISTQSDVEGNFKINTYQREAVLQISYLGYVDQEIKLDLPLSKILIVSLVQADGLLEVVEVNTGYQSIPRERATGSFVQVDRELLNRKVSTDILSRLEDVTPGLIFSRGVGQRASDPPITIRGESTIQANSAPLVVVDNFPYEGDFSTINPNDVESITVLKDAAAASIWGARSGNGVIVITTKKGRYNTGTKVVFNSNLTVGDKPDQFYQSRISTADFIEIEKMLFAQGYYKAAENSANKYPLTPVVEMLIEGGQGSEIEALKQYDVRNDYNKYLNRNSINQQYALSVSGGSDNQQFYLSAGYDDNKSNLIGNGFSRFSFNAKNTLSFFDRKLEFSSNIYYSENKRTADGMSAINVTTPYGSSMSLYPYARLADENGRPLSVTKQYRLSFLEQAEREGLLNWEYVPLDELRLSDNATKATDYLFNAALTYRIVHWISAKALYQYARSHTNSRNLQHGDSYFARNEINRFTIVNADGSLERPIPLGGVLDYANHPTNTYNLRGQLNINKAWQEDHRIDAVMGAEVRDQLTRTSKYRLYGYDDENAINGIVDYNQPHSSYVNPAQTAIRIPNQDAEGELLDRFLSYYTNASYSYVNRYVFSASARLDRSNLFGVKTNQKGVPLYSLGLSWNLSEETFYDFDAVSYLKLRATYGYNGNIDKRTSAYVTARYRPRDPNSGLPFAEIQNPPNPELRWERVRVSNLGLDFSSKGNRLTGSIEYYRKIGVDLIGTTPYPPSSGIVQFVGNYADTKGGGWDIALSSRILNGRFTWLNSLFFSLSKEIVSNYKQIGTISSYRDDTQVSPMEGRPLYSIYSYAWAGLDPKNGDPQGYLDGEVSNNYATILNTSRPEDLIFEGSSRPTKFGAFRNTIFYDRISLSFNISYRLGYYFRRSSINYSTLSTGSGGHGDYALRWQNPGDERHTQVPSMPAVQNNNRNTFYMFSEALVEKGDHIRMQDIRLSYDLIGDGIRKFPLGKMQVYLYANNIGILWKATDVDLDPDYAKSFSPPVRTLSAGLTIDF